MWERDFIFRQCLLSHAVQISDHSQLLIASPQTGIAQLYRPYWSLAYPYGERGQRLAWEELHLVIHSNH